MTDRPAGRLAPNAGRPSSLPVEVGADDGCGAAGAAADVGAAAAEVTPAAAAAEDPAIAGAAAAEVAAAAAMVTPAEVTPPAEVAAPAVDLLLDEHPVSPRTTTRLPAVAARTRAP